MMLMLPAFSSMATAMPGKNINGVHGKTLVARDDYSMRCVKGGNACGSKKSDTLSAACNLAGCKASGGDCTDDGTLEGGGDDWCNNCHCEEDD